MKIFLKQRNLYYMKYWCRKVYDADVSVICCNEYINRDDVTMIEIIPKDGISENKYMIADLNYKINNNNIIN